MNSKRQVKRKLGHVVQISGLAFDVNVKLNLSIIILFYVNFFLKNAIDVGPVIRPRSHGMIARTFNRLKIRLPWVPEAFHARFPVSVKS